MRNLLQAIRALLFNNSQFQIELFGKSISGITTCLILMLLPGLSSAATSVTLAWDPNTEADLAGYRVYYGQKSGEYSFQENVGNTTRYTMAGLEEGKTYYFAVTAFNDNNLESPFSKELAYTIPIETPSDPNCCGQELPPDIPSGQDPAYNNDLSMEVHKPVQTLSYSSALNIDFQLDWESVLRISRAELQFQIKSDLSFLNVYHENRRIHTQFFVKADEFILVDVTDIAAKSNGYLEFRLVFSGLDGYMYGDEIVNDVGLVLYSGDEGHPVAEFAAAPLSGTFPLMVEFDATAAYDPDGQVVSYDWDFGDNTYSDSGAIVNHLYVLPGQYTAKLTVTDDDGNSGIKQVAVNVSDQAYQDYDSSTIVVQPFDFKDGIISFQIDKLNGSVTEAALRFRALQNYIRVIIVNDYDNREIARKYSEGQDGWYEFDLTDVVNSSGEYVFKILAQPLYDVRLLPLEDYEAAEMVVKLE